MLSKNRIKKSRIIACISIVLCLLVFLLIELERYHIDQNLIAKEIQQIHKTGEECVTKAIPISNGTFFGFCNRLVEDESFGYIYIYYDSSDELASQPQQRSAAWNYILLKSPFIDIKKKFVSSKLITGHFYEVTIDTTKIDTTHSLETFKKKYLCEGYDSDFRCDLFPTKQK